MPAKYSIIQFTPDVVTDERINIGVVAFDQNAVRVRFLSKWDRVRRFANQDMQFLKSFAHEFAESASPAMVLPGLDLDPKLTHEHITKMIGKWKNTIQFTEPRASLKPVDELLNEIAPRFLSEPVSHKRNYRDRRAAAGVAASQIRHALIDRVGNAEAEELLKSHSPLQGRHQNHTFDAVVANGVPYLAAHGISFELPEARKLQMHIDAVAWSIKDVRDFDPTLPIGVVTLAPRPEAEEFARLSEIYDQTIRVYTDLGANVLEEAQAEEWAQGVVRRIPV